MTIHIEYIRVPYWRTLRPRYVWVSTGAVVGFLIGITAGVLL